MFFTAFNMLALLAIFCYSTVVVSSDLVEDYNSDVGLDIVQLVQKYGYPIETHSNIATSDGYLLDIHRIPHGKHNSDQKYKPAVFLMHGILCSSVDWIVMGPEKSLGYILADAGYDVWMGNARGTTWSRKHKFLNPDRDAKFWNFSWHEIGTRDLPANIDYILGVTGQEKIFYFGHSQGTTAFYVLASEKPEYNDKIRLMMALSPIVYMTHLISPGGKLLFDFVLNTQLILKFLGLNEFLPHDDALTAIGQQACQDSSPYQVVCSSILFLLAGWDSDQLNKTMLPVIFSNFPAGSSTKQMIHYAQIHKSGYFRQYDYGFIKNFVVYNSASPPDYKLKNIKAPTALFYSSNDWLDAIVDVRKFADQLPNLVFDYLVPYPKFNHLDFIYGINAKEMVYDPAMVLMKNY